MTDTTTEVAVYNGDDLVASVKVASYSGARIFQDTDTNLQPYCVRLYSADEDSGKESVAGLVIRPGGSNQVTIVTY